MSYTELQMFAASLPRLIGDPIEYLKREFLELAVEHDVPLNGFDGAVGPFAATVLDDSVPEAFPDSAVIGDEGQAVCQKTWREYSAVLQCGDGTVLLEVGGVNSAGNRAAKPNDAEVRLWIDYWGVDNVVLKSEIAGVLAEHAGDGGE